MVRKLTTRSIQYYWSTKNVKIWKKQSIGDGVTK